MSYPDGHVEVVGDRPVLAARIYLSDRAERLIASGRNANEVQATIKLWTELGVSRGDILEIIAANTSEEVALFRDLVKMRGWKTFAVITSAFHVGRAKKLLEELGVDADVLPTGRLSTYAERRLGYLVPDAISLMKTHTALKEFAGRAVGR